MSLATFKKKTINQYSSATKISGKPPGGYFLPQGPFGKHAVSFELALQNPSSVGFSIQGGTRNIGYIGKESKMSKQGTPYRGVYPYGSGTYPQNKTGMTYPTVLPNFNSNEVIVLGNQSLFIKPSVLSTYGMLTKKYRWIKTGQYPNVWVQPNYGSSNQSETKSQGNYVHNLTVSSICKIDVNNQDQYIGNIKQGGSTTCHSSAAMFTMNEMMRNAPYTKTIHQPIDSSLQTMRIQKRCTHPLYTQKPFPFATNGNSCHSSINPIYLAPPHWYQTGDNSEIN
jgi:hypothetical protein